MARQSPSVRGWPPQEYTWLGTNGFHGKFVAKSRHKFVAAQLRKAKENDGELGKAKCAACGLRKLLVTSDDASKDSGTCDPAEGADGEFIPAARDRMMGHDAQFLQYRNSLLRDVDVKQPRQSPESRTDEASFMISGIASAGNGVDHVRSHAWPRGMPAGTKPRDAFRRPQACRPTGWASKRAICNLQDSSLFYFP